MELAQIEVKFTYTKSEIPPRCRKPRAVQHEGTLTAHIEVFKDTPDNPHDTDGCPVAFVSHTLNYNDNSSDAPFVRSEFRCRNGFFYRYESRQPADWREHLHKRFSRASSSERTFDEWRNAILAETTRYIIVNDAIYSRSREPVYSVHTYGFGQNHGGTSLYVSETSGSLDLSEFRADELEEAIEYAVSVAMMRGDTNSIDSIKAKGPSKGEYIEFFDLTHSQVHTRENVYAVKLEHDLSAMIEEHLECASRATDEGEDEFNRLKTFFMKAVWSDKSFVDNGRILNENIFKRVLTKHLLSLETSN